MVAQMESRIKEITSGLLDQVQALGEMDVIRDLAYPLPVTVIAELLGIPAERREDFKQWSDAFVSGDAEATEEDRQAGMQAAGSIDGVLRAAPRRRQRDHDQSDWQCNPVPG
jgi:cytochrome P450